MAKYTSRRFSIGDLVPAVYWNNFSAHIQTAPSLSERHFARASLKSNETQFAEEYEIGWAVD
jgi:hypothetical protein